MKLRNIVALVTFILLCAAPLAAQTHTGSVRGIVTDQNGAVVNGATVTLTSDETGEKRTATSGGDGEYIISSLRPGPYRLEIASASFKPHSQGVVLQVNQELRRDVILEVPGSSDYIVVTDELVPLKKDSASLGTVIENKQITGLPLDGRNFYELNLLVPGAVPAAQGSAGSVRGDFAFSVNGAREDSNNFLLDGVYNVDPKLNTFGVRPPVDAIREYEMLTSTYDASFGRNAGAQVNVVLKSGSNDFHGSIYEFFRNGALDARNYFAPTDEPAPKYQRNQFGFSFGGPLVRNRTFFFADYEGTRSREGITRLANVPTLREREGDFSQSAFAPIDPLTGQPFPGGVIPVERQSAIGRRIAALYPAPNRDDAFQNFVSSPVQRDRNDSFDVRLDHSLSGRSNLVFRYSFNDRDLFEPFSGPTFSLVPGYGVNIPRRSQNVMLGETHVFTPAFINEARVAFNRVALGVFQETSGTSVNRAVGLPELSSDPRDFGLSFITVTGFSPLGDEGNNPQHSTTNTYQLLDTATYSRGGHLMKFGADIRFVQQNAFRDVQSRGFLTFSPFAQITGNALGDLLLGSPLLTGGARVDNAQHLRSSSYNFFFNDSWRAHPRLTLMAGLRYEYNSPPVDAEDRANIYDPATRSLVPVGTNGVPRGGFEADKNNFAPRVGFAWTIGDEGRTVVRGGYGVYYDQSPLAPGEALYFNSPYFDFNLFFPLPQFGIPLTLDNPFPANFPFALPDSALAIQRDLRTAYMQHWNLNVQRQLGSSRVLEVAYVGSKGTKLLSARDINQGVPNATGFVIRPVPQFDDINILESRANSNYHSLQTRFQQRLSKGLSALASYTWSKSIDDASNFFTSAGDPNFPQDSFNTRAERGRSNFDVRHRLSVSYSYDLPFGKGRRFLNDNGWLTSVLTGWETYGIVTLQSGRPFTVALLSDIDNSGTGRSGLGFGANDRPNVVGDPALDDPTPERWFNTAAFAFSPRGTFGNAGRNILDGPGYQNVNASLVKNTALTERWNLQLRAEVFNLFNHPNFNLPDNFLGSPSFGRITSAREPRHIQFGVKVLF
ncbi:MAG TPA: TonB-dependent receptor [Pyrinomonadaceae bacterium]|nr:TonB-dependent receptor [Pyrinomonadaceae bacterium]